MGKKRAKRTLPADLARAVDRRSEELIEEYHAHLKVVTEGLLESHGWLVAAEGGIERPRVFEGWCIQKLASLQLLVFDLVERVSAMEARERRER